ncbi:MAG: amino acid ABC transporter permease [Coprobacillus sp.]
MFPAFDKIFTPENLIYLAQGALISLIIAALSLAFGLVFGILGASAKISKNKFLRALGNIYVEVIRGTPMLLQILLLFTVVPMMYTQITNGGIIRINTYVIGVIAMSINSGAYTTELIRSAINGIDKGQWEAADSLGMSHKQTMRFIILPQAFKRIVPPLVSEFVTLIKDSSLISCIGAVELLKASQVLGGNYYDFSSTLCIAGIYYLIMTLSISYFARKLERKLAESD